MSFNRQPSSENRRFKKDSNFKRSDFKRNDSKDFKRNDRSDFRNKDRKDFKKNDSFKKNDNYRKNDNFKKNNDFKKKTNKTIVSPYKNFPGIYTVRSSKSDQLCTLNRYPGHTVYSEKLVQTGSAEYRLWNAYRSKLGAGILCGIAKTYMDSKSKVLYLGAASGTSVSHVADICDLVFAVEFSTRSCRDLINVAKTRNNIIPLAMDARHPAHYRMLVPMCDVIFSDVAQPDQARIVGLNAKYFLKKDGAVLMAIKANCVDCSKNKTEVFAQEVDNLRKEGIKPKEMVELEPYEKDHALVVGIYKGE